MEKKISRIVRTILQRNSKSGEFTSNLKLLQSYSKKVCYVCKYTYRYKYFQIDIQKTIILKSQEVSHYKTNWFFTKVLRLYYWGKNVFSTNSAGSSGYV